MNKKILLAVGITILFLGVVVSPMTLGYDVETSEEQPDTERYLYPEYYDCYSTDEIDGYDEYQDTDISIDYEPVESTKPLEGPPMESSWPMYCHDVRHTGRSPYSTADNPYEEKWGFRQHMNDYIRGSPIIGDDGTIYFGAMDFYALNPNGTLKWKYDDFDGYVWSAPAIDENGTIYVGLVYNFEDSKDFYALNSDGTLKWIYKAGNNIFSSPTIDKDGTIYFGDENKYINALYPNGTLKWRYKTGHVVLSSPAIDDEGIVYCGSHDTYLYALYPNNGTVKWRYKTGNWVRVSPCIADDGTIYIVSLDSYLHAVYPNGTLRWKTDVGAGTSPTIGQDGTIYAGYRTLHAVNPDNGSIKWKLNAGGKIKGATPCNSIDGIIYFGTEIGDYDGGDIVAVNPNGTERWRKRIANQYVDSAPAIAKDGSIYLGSACEEEVSPGVYINTGFLHAFGELDNNAPSVPESDVPSRWPVGVELCITFNSTDPDNNTIKYIIEWGDGKINETNYYKSGESIEICHTWEKMGIYIIRVKAIDYYGEPSEWSEFKIEIPRNRATTYLWYQWLFERFPLLERLLSLLL